MRPRELNNVYFFIKWLNKSHNLDFEINEIQPEENSDVDVSLKSSSTGELLNVQNIAYRTGTIYGKGTSNVPGFNPLFVIGTDKEGDREKSIIECIESKQRKYPKENTKDLILLVEITIPSVKPEELQGILNNNKDKEFSLRGIYFVKLPVIIPEDEYDKTGFCFPFKDAF